MKKKNILFAILLMILLYVPNVLAVNITGCEGVLPNAMIDVKIANLVHTIVVVIKITVPVLLVILGMIDLFKSMMASKEEDMKKSRSIFVKRLISAIIIFFVISIVQLLISFVADSGSEKQNIMDCANCFINGADKNSGKCN